MTIKDFKVLKFKKWNTFDDVKLQQFMKVT